MNLWDILILLALAALVVLALRAIRRGKARCGGNCAACARECAKRK